MDAPCEHQGEPCWGHRYCEICGKGPLLEGWCFEEDANYRCPSKDCEPRDIWIRDVFCATPDEAFEASERFGGNICYYTEWEETQEEICDCPDGCPCYSSPMLFHLE